MTVALILGAWLTLGVAFCGLGLIAARVLQLPARLALTTAFWLGWASTIAVAQLWCLVAPIDGRLEVLVVAGGIAALAVRRADAESWCRGTGTRLWLAPFAIGVCWLADRARSAPENGDSYMYHLPAVAWAEAFRVVPGLGNLHGRLAFNNSTTLYQALVDHWPFDHAGFHVANGLLLLPLLGRGVRAVVALAFARTRGARDALDAVMLAPVIDWGLGHDLSSASPDLPVACLEAAIASELAGWIEGGLAVELVPAVAFLTAALVTIKLSAVGFAVGVGLSILLGLVRQPGRRVWLATTAAGFVLLLPWIIRGVILSGYPAYPSTLAAFHVDWRIPTLLTIEEANYVLAWGRRPGVPWQKVLGSSDWIEPWLGSVVLLNREVLIPFVLGVITLAVAAVRSVLRRSGLRFWRLLLPPTVELVWWLLSSPDPRFAGACLWLLPACGVAILITTVRESRRTFEWSLVLGSVLLVGWPFASDYCVIGPSVAGLLPAPPAVTHEFRTRSGLSLVVPDIGGGCWNAPLLCTPFPRDDVRMRVPGDLRSGFASESKP